MEGKKGDPKQENSDGKVAASHYMATLGTVVRGEHAYSAHEFQEATPHTKILRNLSY